MPKGFLFLLFLLILFVPLSKAQSLEEDSAFYHAFGEEWDFSFLKGISYGISQAVQENNAKALGAYAALFFHAEKISGKQIPELTGLDLLEKATEIALVQENKKDLSILAQIWEESYFGPKNFEIAQNLKKENHGIKIIPSFQEITTGDVVLFRVLKNISLVNMTEIEIPLEQIAFDVNTGKFWQNEYHSSDKTGNVVISVTHRSTGLKAHAILVIKSKENKPDFAWGQDDKQKELQRSRMIEDLLYKKSQAKKVDAIKYYSEQPRILQKILSRSESAKIKATENLINTVKKILEFFPEFLSIQGKNIVLSSETFWAGVKTSEAYIYPEEPYKLRVLASVSSDWIMESLYRSFRRQNIQVTKSHLEKIKKYLPVVLEEEGIVLLD
mgnify:CR=1 FL=1